VPIGRYAKCEVEYEMKQIFIIDDDPIVIRVIRMGLELAGFQVESATDGSEFLRRLPDEAPDMLVTDIEMPKMGGKELCLAIEDQFPDREFPIIVLTSHTALDHRVWTRDIPNLKFMEKPVSVRRLVAHANEHLGRPT